MQRASLRISTSRNLENRVEIAVSNAFNFTLHHAASSRNLGNGVEIAVSNAIIFTLHHPGSSRYHENGVEIAAPNATVFTLPWRALPNLAKTLQFML